MSLYGAARRTTPAIDALSNDGVSFTRAFSTSPWTLPAHASMLTGRYPSSLSPNASDPLYRLAPMLSTLLKQHGYRTAAVIDTKSDTVVTTFPVDATTVQLSATLGITGPMDKLVVEGPVKLENSKLEGFDLGSKLSALSAFSGKAAGSRDTTIQNASAGARVAPEGTRVDSINVTVPSLGVLTGAGTVSASGALNFKMMAELSGAGERVEKLGRREGSSGGGIPFTIEGTTADPKFVPDVKGIAGSAAKQAISGKINPQGESAKKGLGGMLKKKF
jgi:hypothetical protein